MNQGQPTPSEIRAAKSQAVGGRRKRCKKGKNCSAACIQSGMVCLVEMPEPVGVSLKKVAALVGNRAPSPPPEMKKELANLGGAPKPPTEKPNSLAGWGTEQLRARREAAWQLMQDDRVARFDKELERRGEPVAVKAKTVEPVAVKAKTVDKVVETAPPKLTSANTKWARDDAKDFDDDLVTNKLQRVGDKSYTGWNDSHGKGATKVGEGSYGTVVKNPDGTYVKRGAISDDEAALIQALGKKDLGPKLVAADVNGEHDWVRENFVNIRNGRIAMTEVPGKPMGETTFSDTVIGGKKAADIYWKAMGDLHRLGIAHNDAHTDNILVDNTGKGRWVDLGLAQKSPKAAFAEAFGSFSKQPDTIGPWDTPAGNWQTPRWNATGIKDWERATILNPDYEKRFYNDFSSFGKVLQNRPKVAAELRRMGYTSSEMATLQNTPIRSPLSTFEQGPWAKMTDKQAAHLIDLFYDGV